MVYCLTKMSPMYSASLPKRDLSSSTRHRVTSSDAQARGTLAYHVTSTWRLTPHCRKTTTMMFKMLGIQRAWKMHFAPADGDAEAPMPMPRQMFVTQSTVLADKVREYFVKLLASLGAGNPDKPLRETPEDYALIDSDDKEEWDSKLPGRFGELQDEHFPLFVTFNKVCLLRVC